MNSINLFGKHVGPLKILCLGAHSDDIEIGCGGTILRLLSEYDNIELIWVVMSANGVRRLEATGSSGKFLTNCKNSQTILGEFRDGFFPYIGAEVKAFFEQLKRELPSPDVIFTHFRNDLHQDHRLVSELTWNTFRNHLILEYEVMKYDGDLGNPNFFVQLEPHYCQRKIDYLLESFPSQASHHWFSQEAFYALLRLRGIECNASAKYAEAFYCRKIMF